MVKPVGTNFTLSPTRIAIELGKNALASEKYFCCSVFAAAGGVPMVTPSSPPVPRRKRRAPGRPRRRISSRVSRSSVHAPLAVAARESDRVVPP